MQHFPPLPTPLLPLSLWKKRLNFFFFLCKIPHPPSFLAGTDTGISEGGKISGYILKLYFLALYVTNPGNIYPFVLSRGLLFAVPAVFRTAHREIKKEKEKGKETQIAASLSLGMLGIRLIAFWRGHILFGALTIASWARSNSAIVKNPLLFPYCKCNACSL